MQSNPLPSETDEILLAQPRGFCAGVDRAINIVNEALTRFGAPIYVRHEIVHNKYVVDELRAKGAIFVDLRIQHQSDFVYLIQEDFDQQAVF